MIAKRMTAGLATAGCLLALWAGCQSTQQTIRTKPGELPAGDEIATVQPRLSATTYFAHGHLLERQGQFERAAVQYSAALKLRPEFVTARNRLGITLNKLGKHAEATKEFEAAIAKHPGSAYLFNNLGFSLYLENRLTESVQALQRALELRPTFSRARMNRGIVLAKLGRFDEAFGEFTMVGTEADAYYNLAMIQADAGHYPQAQRSLESALARNPAFEPARQKLAEVSQRNALLHPDGVGSITPQIVMAPTETIVTPPPAAVAAEPVRAAPARSATIAEAPTTPRPAVTIAPLTQTHATPTAIAAPTTPTPTARNSSIQGSNSTAAAKPIAVARTTDTTPANRTPTKTSTPIAAMARPTPVRDATPAPVRNGVVDLTAQVRDVTPGRAPAAATPIATPTTPRTIPAAAIQTITRPATPTEMPPQMDEELIDEEALEEDAEEIPLDAIDRLIDAIQRGDWFDAIWCELEGAFRRPVRVVGGETSVQ